MRRALWLRAEWSGRSDGDSLHQAIQAFGQEPAEMRVREAEFYAVDPAAQQHSAAIEVAAEELQSDAAWRVLTRTLTQAEEHLLVVCLAAESDPNLRRLYGYLLDEPSPRLASPWLAEVLFGWDPGTIVGPTSWLYRARLAGPSDTRSWSKTTEWLPDPLLLGYLHGELVIPDEIATAVKLDNGASAEWPVLFPAAATEALEFLRAMKDQPAVAYEIEIVGPAGTGRRTLASQLASRVGRNACLQIDVAALHLDQDQDQDASTRIAKASRTAYLSGTVPVWIGAELLPTWSWEAMEPASRIRILVTGRTATAPRSGVVRRTIKTGTLAYHDRIDVWTRLTGSDPPAPVRDLALSVGDLVAAAQVAPRGVEAVADVCRGGLGHDEDSLLSPLSCPFTWDDLVVQGHVEQHLHEFESQVRLRHAVFDDWGFGRQGALGLGVSALFCGPSGVGKTMAAQVIARSLGLELLRMDFASVMNKYVGETEKRIRQVFQRCQRPNVMLFIDECDAIFTHRVQTRDAQDRFANIEVDYLLQCMETFEGVAVLATNRKSEIDGAFLRRLRFIVDFIPPTQSERVRLWQLSLPTTSPSGEPILGEIDFQLLAQKLSLTGAEIRNVAIGAAFLARAEHTRIGVKHVIAAARREVAKHGTVVRPGEWEGL
jgi:MoxR-like ATPase